MNARIMIKRFLLFFLAAFVVTQFFRPDRAVPAIDPAQDMLAVTAAPADVRDMVVGACYDCHSYVTQYPWYAGVTPVNFIMQDHIEEGREVLNFSLWGKYAGTEAAGECGETIQEDEMPPGYYRFMHAHGKLTPDQRQRLISWFGGIGGGDGEGAGQAEQTGAGAGEEEEAEED